jgi:hypothetical protein
LAMAGGTVAKDMKGGKQEGATMDPALSRAAAMSALFAPCPNRPRAPGSP